MSNPLILEIPAFSINKMSYRDKRYKTQEAKDWTYDVLEQLNKPHNQAVLEELRNNYDSSKHAYSVTLTFYYPSNILFTLNGNLSAKAHDISNIEKPLLDIIFLSKYYKLKAPYGAKNLNIDDKYLSDMKSKKRPSNAHAIVVEFEIMDLKDINKTITLESILERHTNPKEASKPQSDR